MFFIFKNKENIIQCVPRNKKRIEYSKKKKSKNVNSKNVHKRITKKQIKKTKKNKINM